MKLFYPTILPGDAALENHDATAAGFRARRAERSDAAVAAGVKAARRARKERDRRHRQNLRDKKRCVTVRVDGAVINWLIYTRWLDERDAADRARIGDAIGAMLTDSARRRGR